MYSGASGFEDLMWGMTEAEVTAKLGPLLPYSDGSCRTEREIAGLSCTVVLVFEEPGGLCRIEVLPERTADSVHADHTAMLRWLQARFGQHSTFDAFGASWETPTAKIKTSVDHEVGVYFDVRD